MSHAIEHGVVGAQLHPIGSGIGRIAPSAGPEVIALTDPAGSLRFPENNHETAVAGSFGALYQPIASFPDLFAADGAFFAILGVPLDRMHDNRRYKIVGQSGTGTGGRGFQVAYYGTDYHVSGSRGLLEGTARGTAGTTITVKSLAVDETAILVVFKRKTNSGPSVDFSIDWYSLTDGAKHAGTAQTGTTFTGLASILGPYIGIGVGYYGALPSSGSFSIARPHGHFPGSIGALGYVAADIDDADWQSIALGADIVTTLGASNLTYLREFDGTADTYGPPTAATSDATGDCVAVDGDNLLPGSHIRRQDTTNYLTIDTIPTGMVFGLPKGSTSRSVTFSGTAGGYTGNVEVRIVGEDGTVHKDWTVVGAISAGAWSGAITVNKMSQWCWLQARPASTPAVIAEMRDLFGVGFLVGVWGQSQCELFFQKRNGSVALDSGSLRKISVSAERQYEQVTRKEKIFRLGAHTGSDGCAAFADQWVAYGDTTPLCLVAFAEQGTSSLQLVNDSDSARDWSDVTAILDYLGDSQFTAHLWQWGTSMVGAVQANVMNQFVSGDNTLGQTDHYLEDGEFAAGWSFIMSPFCGSRGATAGPLDTDEKVTSGAARDEQIAWAVSEGYTVGPCINDLFLEGNANSHQDLTNVKGNPLFGARLAMAVARDLSLDATTNPSVAGAAFTDGTEDTISVTFTLPNGGSLTTDGADAAVTGFEVSDDSGSTWSRSGFSAEISGNTVVLTKTSGTWTGGGATQVRYDAGGPLAYGTSTNQADLLAGQLYETISTPDYAGLGMPVAGSNTAKTVAAA